RGSRRQVPVPFPHPSRRDPRTSRRDDVAVVPADAKSIATKPVWRNPEFRPLGLPEAAKFMPGARRHSPIGPLGGCQPRASVGDIFIFHSMSSPFYDPTRDLAAHVEAYQRTGDVGHLLDQL